MKESELKDYLDLLFSYYNPVYLSVVIFILIVAVIYLSYKYIYRPILQKNKQEKDEFEENTAKLLAVFSELDPNPILRINQSGVIVYLNKSAKNKFKEVEIDKSDITDVIEIKSIRIKDAINKDMSFNIQHSLSERFYDIDFHGIAFPQMAQLYFRDVTLQRNYDEQMKHYQNLLRTSSTHLQKVIDEERNRISGILHDSVNQNLLLVNLYINNYTKSVSEDKLSDHRRILRVMESTIGEVRELAHQLRPLKLKELGLNTAIKSMCFNISREAGIDYRLKLPSENIILKESLEIAIYKIIQESLNNILRHSKANRFEVSMEIKDTSVSLSIEDNGIGFAPKKLLNEKYISDGIGIMNMQEIVESQAGVFSVKSVTEEGTIITAEFPIETKKDDTKSEYKNISS